MSSPHGIPYGIRPFDHSPSDYAAVAQVISEAWPSYPVSPGDLRRIDRLKHPDLLYRRLVAEAEGGLLAVCAFRESEGSYRPGKYIFGLTVRAAHRGRGIGGALYRSMVEALEARGLATLLTNTLEDHNGALRFLARRGFERVMRSPVSRLDVAAFRPAPFLPARQRTRARGIAVRSLADLQPLDDQWRRKCWDLSWEIDQDIPTVDRLTRPSLARYSKQFENPNFAPAGWYLALDGEDWVGLHTIWPNKTTPKTFYTGVTGVRRAYRRRGIATALKLAGIAFVGALGGRVLETNNEENNPMYDLNLTLGFRPAPAWITLRRTI